MGLFSIFKRRKKGADDKVGKPSVSSKPVQYLQAIQFNQELTELLGRDAYIARSDYKHLIINEH